MERLFVAVWPGDAVREWLGGLPSTFDGYRTVPPDNWHVTLRFLGDVDPLDTERALAHAQLPRATGVLQPTLTTLGDQLVVPVTGLDDLAAAVQATTGHLGGQRRHPFNGHVTIARRSRRRAERDGRHEAATSATRVSGATSFDVTEIALVSSELLQDGARYTTRATFPTRS